MGNKYQQIAIIATAIVTLTGGSGFSVYKWQQAELEEVKLHIAGQNALSFKEGYRLSDLEQDVEDLQDALKAVTDSLGVMNITINRMEVTLNFLADGL